jgi:hypothetical protein
VREPSTTELLDAWERGLGMPAAERAVALLAAGEPGSSHEHAALALGERDARLLALRRWAFGSRIDGVAGCPSCGAELELSVDAHDILLAPPAAPNGEELVRLEDYEVRFRLPDSRDAAEAGRAGTVAAARRVLLQRCVTGASRNGSAVEPLALPEDVVERIEEAMAERDPQADVRLALTCSECGHRWEAGFDAGRFVWTEVDRWAKRVLVDVATLASAFGWTEAEVLRLSPSRRDAYLELAGG